MVMRWNAYVSRCDLGVYCGENVSKIDDVGDRNWWRSIVLPYTKLLGHTLHNVWSAVGVAPVGRNFEVGISGYPQGQGNHFSDVSDGRTLNLDVGTKFP